MSIQIEFKSFGPGKCRWCKRDKEEVIELAFADGSFVGRYCFADFKKALLDKLDCDGIAKSETKPQVVPATMPVVGNGPAK